MNSIKAFFELNWEVFLSDLCEVMGYKSETAKYVAKTCKDHHKAWELIMIFFLGTLRELVTIYVREKRDSVHSTTGFFEFTKSKANNPNFIYMFSQIATYAFAIINFRMGMRRNNHMVMLSAVNKVNGVFHGRNHPFYQLIEVYFMAQLFTMQKEVNDIYELYSTISLSGDPSKAEDWDFVLENVNKKTQSWIPKGVPNDKIWLNVCRNVDPLEKLRSSHFEMIGMTKKDQKYRRRDLSKEIDEWRLVLRKSNYLRKTEFVSMSGKSLEPDLLNFTSLAKAHRYFKIGSMFLNAEITDERLCRPIFVTLEEKERYNNVHNLTKSQIREKTSQLINAIQCQDTADYYLDYFKTSVKDRKADLIQFYEDLQRFVDDQYDDTATSEDEE